MNPQGSAELRVLAVLTGVSLAALMVIGFVLFLVVGGLQ